LFVWGTIVTAGPPDSGGAKVLASHKELSAIVSTVQIITLVNGGVLVLSGVGIRRGWRWGQPLAIACGIVSVVAGGVFLSGCRYLEVGASLEHGVARVMFVRDNLDMLIGLVDGLGLIWFLTTRYPAGLPSQEPVRQPSSSSHP